MALRIDRAKAVALMRTEGARARGKALNQAWVAKVERLSQLCEEGTAKTHIAFLGTAVLAKAMDRRADLLAIKPEHAPGNPNAFSARTLCHGVLVPAAAELGINIGVTGREPLNNQPYFRMTRLDDGTPVSAGGRAAFEYMMQLVRELADVTEEEARGILRSYIAVRQRYQRTYADYSGASESFSPVRLVSAIRALVARDSEGGKTAQAVVAALFDVFAGDERVESGRVNDPSRRHPGDVCVQSTLEGAAWGKAAEVRDKPVTETDVQIFAKKCVDMDVREVALVMVSDAQPPLDRERLQEWADAYGIGLTLFFGWESIVEQALFWAELPKPVAAARAAARIHARLVSVEASSEAIELWSNLLLDEVEPPGD